MLNFGIKEFRNLQEQVLYLSNRSNFGLNIKGEVETVPQLGDIPNTNIGDVYLVGKAAPFNFYIKTADKTWTNLGKLESNVPGPQGLQGIQGIKGTDGSVIYTNNQPESANNGDLYISNDGKLYQYDNEWKLVTSLRGSVGPVGPKGPEGPRGLQGERGEKGEKGNTGIGIRIGGNVATEDLLPSKPVGDTNAYLVGHGSPYELYVWNGTGWLNSGEFGTLDNIQVITIKAPETATSGQLNAEQLNQVIESTSALIKHGNLIYRKEAVISTEAIYRCITDDSLYVISVNTETGSWVKTSQNLPSKDVNILDTGLSLGTLEEMRTQYANEQEVNPTITNVESYYNNTFISLTTSDNAGTRRVFTKSTQNSTFMIYMMSVKNGKFMFTANFMGETPVFKLSYHPTVAIYDIGLDLISFETMKTYLEETEVFPTKIPTSFKAISSVSILTSRDDNAKRIFTKVTENSSASFVNFMMATNDGHFQFLNRYGRYYIKYIPYPKTENNEEFPNLKWVNGEMIIVTGDDTHGKGDTFVNANYSRTDYFKVEGYNSITFTIPTAPEASQNAGLAFYDVNKRFISGILHIGNQSSASFTTITRDIPSNAVYARTDFRTAQLGSFSLKFSKGLAYTDKALITSTNEWNNKIPTYSQIIAKYDAMVGEYNDLIVPDDDTQGSSASVPYKYRVTKKVLGRDGSQTYDVYEYTFSPTDYKWTVFFHCVMHGYEEQTTLAMYQLLEHIVNNDSVCQNSPVLTFMRKYVRIYLIPVLNPYGLTNRTYTGQDGVNPSRNFPYYWAQYPSTESEWDKKGSAPFSNQETKLLLKAYIDHAGELDFDIDYHTGDEWSNFPMFYYDNTDSFVRPALLNAAQYMIGLGVSNNPIMQETGRALNLYWANRCLGVPSATIEVGCNYFSDVRNSADQLAPLMWSYTCYWSALFSQLKPTRGLNTSTIRRMTKEQYENLPYRLYNTLYLITNDNYKKRIGDISLDNGWYE